MEEKFLKGRQEREEQRQQRSLEGVEITAQRQQYEAEADKLQTEVTQLLKDNKVAESQQRIDALRRLVQDTSNSISLTPYEMAKANAALARLQQLVDEAKGAQTEPKKFKFSSRLKTKANGSPSALSTAAPTVETGSALAKTMSTETRAVDAPHTSTHTGPSSCFGNSYGPSTGTDLFIASSKGAFIKSCTECSIFCLPITGSVFLSNCTKCCVYVACHQLRLKDCRDTKIFVWCASRPIIETCTNMLFGPYSCWEGLLRSTASDGATYATHAEWVRCVGEIADTSQTEQNYSSVEDFQWVRKTASPHWRVMTNEEMTHSSTVFGPATLANKSGG